MQVILIIIFIPITIFVRAFVLCNLWDWFIVSLFFEMPSLTFAVAAGISLVTTLLCYQSDARKEDDETPSASKILSNQIMHGVLEPLIVLLLGWIINMFQ